MNQYTSLIIIVEIARYYFTYLIILAILRSIFYSCWIRQLYDFFKTVVFISGLSNKSYRFFVPASLFMNFPFKHKSYYFTSLSEAAGSDFDVLLNNVMNLKKKNRIISLMVSLKSLYFVLFLLTYIAKVNLLM